jgi:hypothetical protein
VGGPVALAGGVYWTRDNVVITGHAGRRAPAGFDPTGAVTKGASLLADGDTFAWIDTATMSSIKVSRNAAAPVTVVPAGRGGRPTGLTGDLLWWGGSVLDLRTGAAAEVGQPDVARGHTAAVQLADGRLSVLHTAALPGLHC